MSITDLPPAAGGRPASPDADPLAEFRAWDRALRQQRRSPAARRRALFTRALRPGTALRKAQAAVRAFGAEVTAVSGVSPWRQVAQLWWLGTRYDVDAESYLDYQLYRPERFARGGRYVCSPAHTRVQRALYNALDPHGDRPRLRDKRQFAAWCAERDLPTVPVFAEWQDGTLVHDDLPDGRLPARDLFSKPPDMSQGFGTARWVYDGAGSYRGPDGQGRTEAALRAELAAMSRALPKRRGRGDRRLILMPTVENHPTLRALTTGALCTTRMLTYRTPGGPPQLLYATHKMAMGDAPADNFHFGGMLAPVDLATGRLGMGLRRRGRVLVPTEHHPDTGARVPEQQLPDWSEALALVQRAHGGAPAVPAIGWDVALTPAGPILIEGNLFSAADIAQAPTGRPLGDTPYIAAMNAHLRALAR